MGKDCVGCYCCSNGAHMGEMLVGVPVLWSVGGGLAGLLGIDVNIPTSAFYHAQTPGALCPQ